MREELFRIIRRRVINSLLDWMSPETWINRIYHHYVHRFINIRGNNHANINDDIINDIEHEIENLIIELEHIRLNRDNYSNNGGCGCKLKCRPK